MSENLTGPDVPAVPSETPTAEPAQLNADTTAAQTDGAGGGEEVPAPEPEKTFTQAELDAIISREKAKSESKAERRVLKQLERIAPPSQPQPQQRQQAAPSEAPRRDSFDDDEKWLDARDAWRDQQRDARAAQERQQQQTAETLRTTEKIYAEAAKLPGFDREDFDALPLTKPIVKAIIESDLAPKLMAHLSANPDEITRIAALSETRQIIELGKIETKLSEKPAIKASKAPPPISTVGGNGGPVIKDLNTASMEDYRAMRAKQGARWAK